MEPWWFALFAGILGAVLGFLFGRGSRDRGVGDLLSSLVDTTPVALLVYSDTGRIVFANRRAEELFYEGQSLSSKNFLQLVGQAPAPLKEALLGEAQLFTLVTEGHAETFQLSRVDVAIDDEPHTLLMVNHLTREVSRREVDVLKKVIRVIGHELNNSLASVSSLLGSARFIARNPEHLERLDEVLGAVEERAEHLKGFLAGYAELARMPRPRKKEVEWEPLLTRMHEMFPEAKIPEPPTEPGYFDETQIEQLLINLLKNAGEAGGDRSEVEVVVRLRDDGGWDLRVLDRGKGFSDEALRNALLPFYTTKPGGSGMGLALSREVAEGHGGSLGIRAREGGGTAVTCTLPPKAAPARSRTQLTLTRA